MNSLTLPALPLLSCTSPASYPMLWISLIPRPLLPRAKGSKNLLIRILAPLPRERGWGEAEINERGWVEVEINEMVWGEAYLKERVSGVSS
jgi:hypothetical protein